jgi:hypothetical protein
MRYTLAYRYVAQNLELIMLQIAATPVAGQVA